MRSARSPGGRSGGDGGADRPAQERGRRGTARQRRRVDQDELGVGEHHRAHEGAHGGHRPRTVAPAACSGAVATHGAASSARSVRSPSAPASSATTAACACWSAETTAPSPLTLSLSPRPSCVRSRSCTSCRCDARIRASARSTCCTSAFSDASSARGSTATSVTSARVDVESSPRSSSRARMSPATTTSRGDVARTASSIDAATSPAVCFQISSACWCQCGCFHPAPDFALCRVSVRPGCAARPRPRRSGRARGGRCGSRRPRGRR